MSTLPAEPQELFLGMIFDPTVEGSGLQGQTSHDLEELQSTLAAAVDAGNAKELAGSEEFGWQGLDYYPLKDMKHDHFFWARIHKLAYKPDPSRGFRASTFG